MTRSIAHVRIQIDQINLHIKKKNSEVLELTALQECKNPSAETNI